MTACTEAQLRKFEHSRNFLNVPALDGGCGTQTIYYGRDCQLMEITGAQRNVRNASSPLRTWNRRSREFCNVGNTVSAPDIPSGTLRFYEMCGTGIPLPHMLGRCDFNAVINHGLCKTQGDICDFGDYAEVYRLNMLSENRGRRTSFDGTDEALVDELNVEFLDVYDVTRMEFTDVLAEEREAGNITADSFASDIHFICESGCGTANCGCTESCNDGTQAYFIGIGSETGTSQVAYSLDGGVTTTILDVPQNAPSIGDNFTAVAVFNGNLYVLANSDPAELFSIPLDDNNEPIGTTFTSVNIYTATSDSVALKVCGNDDTMGILTDEGFYTLSNTDDGSTAHLVNPNVADPFNGFDCCGSTVVVVGSNGVIHRSVDTGNSFAPVTAPNGDDFFRVSVFSADTFWVTTNTGLVWRTTDAGENWDQIRPSGVEFGQNTYITFANQNIGYVLGNTGQAENSLYSTWLGGLSDDVWCNGTNRLGSYPDLNALDVVVPECADANLTANTVAVLGRYVGGTEAAALIGRPQITF